MKLVYVDLSDASPAAIMSTVAEISTFNTLVDIKRLRGKKARVERKHGKVTLEQAIKEVEDVQKGTERIILSYDHMDHLANRVDAIVPNLALGGLSRPGPYGKNTGLWPLEVQLHYDEKNQKAMARILCYADEETVDYVLLFPGMEELVLATEFTYSNRPSAIYIIPELCGGKADSINAAVPKAHRTKLLLACVASYAAMTRAEERRTGINAFADHERAWESSKNVLPEGIHARMEQETLLKLNKISRLLQLGVERPPTAAEHASKFTASEIGAHKEQMRELCKGLVRHDLKAYDWEDIEAIQTRELQICRDKYVIQDTLARVHYPVRRPSAPLPLQSEKSFQSLRHVPMFNATVFITPIDRQAVHGTGPLRHDEVVPRGLALLDGVLHDVKHGMQEAEFTCASTWLNAVKTHSAYSGPNEHKVKWIESNLHRAVTVTRVARCCLELENYLTQDDAPRVIRIVDVSLVYGVHLPQDITDANTAMIRTSMINFMDGVWEACVRLPGNVVYNSKTAERWESMREFLGQRVLDAIEVASGHGPETVDLKTVLHEMFEESFRLHVRQSVIDAKEYIERDVNHVHQAKRSLMELKSAAKRSNRRTALETWWKRYGGSIVTEAMDGLERMHAIGAIRLPEYNIGEWKTVRHRDKRLIIDWLLQRCVAISMSCHDLMIQMKCWMEACERDVLWRLGSVEGTPGSANAMSDVRMPIQPPPHIGTFHEDRRLHLITKAQECKSTEHIIPEARVHWVLYTILHQGYIDLGNIGRNQLQHVLSAAYSRLEKTVGNIIEDVLKPTALECGMGRFPSAALIGW